MTSTGTGGGQGSGTDRRRKRLPAIPADYDLFLNEAQRVGVRNLEGFGWSLYFIRRPLFQTPTVVMQGPSIADYAVLNSEGCLERRHELVVR